jgi:ketosteroid isomerase-like protein
MYGRDSKDDHLKRDQILELMMTLWKRRLILFACPAMAIVAVAIAAESDDTRDVRELEEQVNGAVLAGDVATFDRLFAKDFTHTSHDGRFRTRAEWMKGRVQGKSSYKSYDIEDLQIRSYGTTAVVTCLVKPSWTETDGGAASGRFRLLRVWVKRDGRWQVVAFQSTRLSETKE